MSCCSTIPNACLYFSSASFIWPFRYSSLPSSRFFWTVSILSSSLNCQDSFSYSFGRSIEIISDEKTKNKNIWKRWLNVCEKPIMNANFQVHQLWIPSHMVVQIIDQDLYIRCLHSELSCRNNVYALLSVFQCHATFWLRMDTEQQATKT